MEASGFIGLWALTSTLTIVISYYNSEVYRAKGRPKLSVLGQVLHIVVLWPVVLIAVRYGFEVLYWARSLVRLEGILVGLCIMGIAIKMPVGKIFTNILPTCIAAACMFLVMLLPEATNLVQSIVYAVFAGLIYLGVIMLFPKERKILLNIQTFIKRQ